MERQLLPFALLKQQTLSPRTDLVRVLAPGDNFDWVVFGRKGPVRQEPLMLDFETKGDWGEPSGVPREAGNACWTGGSHPVGCALADSRGSFYIPLPDAATYRRLCMLLKEEQTPLIAFNVFFDAGWFVRDHGAWHNWVACAYATYKLLATEGWVGQEWGLKAAQTQLLGWPESNEHKLGQWLVDNGYTKSKSTAEKPGYYLRAVDGKWYTPDKSQMWRAPHDILGWYSALDAEALWQLWTYVLQPALQHWRSVAPGVREYWDRYPAYIHTLIRQRVRGILIDKEGLDAYGRELDVDTAARARAFRDGPLVLPQIRRFGELVAASECGQEPPKYKAAPVLGSEPARTTKSGAPSKSWERWEAKRQRLASQAPELTARWQAWATKRERLLAEAHSGQLWKITSGDHRRWLLYDALGYQATGQTESGLPSVDGAALQACGEVGAALSEFDGQVKVRQFVTQVLSLLHGDSLGKGPQTLHPGFRVPATLTGRLGGKNPNIQQMPKDKRFLSAFRARSGYKLVTCDVVSLENFVLAELSRDPALWRLYGPDARPGQDAYLFNASQLPIIGPRIRATGYDPDTATPEDTARAKKLCKAERSIGKVLTLSANYGAGPRKIHQTLELQGVKVTLEDVQEMHTGFWRLYAGIKDWERELNRQWERNGGWVLNGIGRPIGVDEGYRKDLVNRVVQSTGHDCLVMLLAFTEELLRERKLDAHPLIADLHDASFMEVRADRAEEALRIMSVDAYDKLNEWLGGEIPLRGSGAIGDNWGELKDD